MKDKYRLFSLSFTKYRTQTYTNLQQSLESIKMTTVTIISIAIFLRYILISFLIEKVIASSKLKKVMSLKRKTNQKKKEILLSLYSSILFGIAFSYLFSLWENGTLIIDVNIKNMSLGLQVLYIIAALFIHETYYYWLHRLMHHKKIYKYIHKGHHDSIEVSSWTAFAFDPLETIFQILPLFIIVFIFPLHLFSIVFLLLVMSLSAAINHLNYEIYPSFFKKRYPFKLFIGATHHALHHKEYKTNYGLYFTFWDKWMNTESKNY